MDVLFNQILNFVLIYGYPVIGLYILVSSIGIPLPQTSMILAAGSLSAAGDFNIVGLFFLITICSIGGDLVDYFLGRFIGFHFIKHIRKFVKPQNKVVHSARSFYTQWSGLSIFTSRFLFTPLASPISVLSGLSKYAIGKFLFFDILGQILSSIIFLSIGYFFNAGWVYFWEYMDSVPGILTIFALSIFLVIFGIRIFVIYKKQ